MITRDIIWQDVTGLLKELRGDWELDVEIREDSYVLEDLGLESIDVVALGTGIEEAYQRPLPFAQFLVSLKDRDQQDITVGELVDFVARELHATEAQPAR